MGGWVGYLHRAPDEKGATDGEGGEKSREEEEGVSVSLEEEEETRGE